MKKTLTSVSALAVTAVCLSSPTVQARAFAPYVDMTLWPTPQIDKIGVNQGIQQFTLAFVVAQNGCNPSWGGVLPIPGASSDQQSSAISAGITNFRAKGGEVMVSFGGANGTPLQQACTSNASLQAAYQKVLDTYNLNRIDFDIEGGAQTDAAANNRNFAVVAALQKNYKAKGKTLHVSLTLPVMPFGLTQDGQNVLNSALSNGVALDTVNIMAMDYGQHTADMGAAAKQAAQALYGQLDAAYKAHGQTLTDAQLWQKVGVTPMIGLNDTQPETFTVANANNLYGMANSNNFGVLSMWSVSRDKSCPGNGSYVDSQCSGIVQTPYAFSNVFKGFKDHWGSGVTQDPNYGGGGSGGSGGSGGPVNGQPWSAGQTYNTGNTVTYAGATWTAQYWTQGNTPGQSAPWRQTAGPLQSWNVNVAYQGGDCASYQGAKYCAKWYAQGIVPTAGDPWYRAN
ncbi:chitinase [Chromobacterium amazonense]|uniref:chitinase n=1 Tax=Chromobacterium amazonense TaxID=1382803 RepID=UPI0008DA4C82|nr:carbohydrate-binding protein [Chromobacterium amazonense]OHX15238.1 chitinase [Chromobacterium amazonense]